MSLADAGAGAAGEWARREAVLGEDAELSDLLGPALLIGTAAHVGGRLADGSRGHAGRNEGGAAAPESTASHGAAEELARREAVSRNMALDPEGRVRAAGEALGRPLSEGEARGLLAAHEAGSPDFDGYSVWNLKTKVDKLRSASFAAAERRRLIELGLVGEEPGVDAYAKFPFLRDHEPFLGPSPKLIGQGDNAVVVTHPKDASLVVKIAKPLDGVDDLRLEFENHSKFLEAFMDAVSAGEIPPGVKVPFVLLAPSENEGYFLMERVFGQSLRSKCLIGRLDNLAKFKPVDGLGRMSDAQVEEIYLNATGKKREDIVQVLEDYGAEHLMALRYDRMNPMAKTPLALLEAALRKRGVAHADLNYGNVMIADDGTVYIIDFARAKVNR